MERGRKLEPEALELTGKWKAGENFAAVHRRTKCSRKKKMSSEILKLYHQGLFSISSKREGEIFTVWMQFTNFGV